MGGNASSTSYLQSLGASIQSIERKLLDIDQIQQHHEDSIISDDGLIISGKKIICSSTVNLVTGPIMGFVSSSVCRILVECDEDCELYFYVFREDKILKTERFWMTFKCRAERNVPKVCQLEALDHDTKYIVYIGGINSFQTLSAPLHFSTLAESVIVFRPYIVNSMGLANGVVGRDKGWQMLKQKVCVAPALETKHSSMVLTFGDTNLMDSSIANLILNLLELGCSNRSSAKDLITSLESFEVDMQLRYRKVFDHEDLKLLGRYCPSIFFNSTNSVIEYLSTLSFTYSSNENELSMISDAHALDAEKCDDESGGEASPFGYNVKETRSEEPEVVRPSSCQAGIVKMIISAVARILRRMDWLYFRQMIDPAAEIYVVHDLQKERILREILIVSKNLFNQSAGVAKGGISMISNSMAKELEKLAEELAHISLTLHSPQAFTFVRYAPLAVILVDSFWNCLTSDGSLSFTQSTMALEDSVLESLSTELVNSNSDQSIQVLFILSTNPFLNYSTSATFHQNSDIINSQSKEFCMWCRLGLSATNEQQIVELVAAWQQVRDDRAALICSPSCSAFSSSSILLPLVSAEEFSTDKWHVDAAGVQEILLGSSNLGGLYNHVRHWTRAATSDLESIERTSTIVRCSKISYDESVGFWEVIYEANRKEIDSVPRRLNLFPDFFVLRRCSSFNVVVGKVTETSAVVILNINDASSQTVNLRCIDSVSGVEVHCDKVLEPKTLFYTFIFTSLLPNTHYQILYDPEHFYFDWLSECVQSSLSGCQVVGSFCTKDTGLFSVQKDYNEGITVSEPFRLLLPGSFSPSHFFFNDYAREYSQELADCAHCLNALLSVPWNGIDVVLHFTTCIDWERFVREVAPHLKALEEATILQAALQEHVRSAQACIARAFKLFLSNPGPWRISHAHSCHLFLFDPVKELFSQTRTQIFLSDLNPSSLAVLSNLLSDYCNSFRKQMWPNHSQMHPSTSLLFHAKGLCIFEIARALADSSAPLDFQTLVPANASVILILLKYPILGSDSTALGEEQTILDACASWMMNGQSKSRKVLILAAASGVGFSSEITLRKASGQLGAEDVLCTIQQMSFGLSNKTFFPFGTSHDLLVTDAWIESSRDMCYFKCSHKKTQVTQGRFDIRPIQVEINLGANSSNFVSNKFLNMEDLKQYKNYFDFSTSKRLMSNKLLLGIIEIAEAIIMSKKYEEVFFVTEQCFAGLSKTVFELREAVKFLIKREVQRNVASIMTKFEEASTGRACIPPHQYYQNFFAFLITTCSVEARRVLKIPSFLSIVFAWRLLYSIHSDVGSQLTILNGQVEFILTLFVLTQQWQFCAALLSQEKGRDGF